MFVVGASLTVPFFTIVLRKSYGLGAQAMAGGSFKAPVFTVAWPTGEFGGMGLEGSVKLGYRKELEALEDPAERKALYDQMVANAYAHGKALNTATYYEIDDVIDPAESRRWVTARSPPRRRRRRAPRRSGPASIPGSGLAAPRPVATRRGRVNVAGAPRPGDRTRPVCATTSSHASHAGLKRRSESSFA